MTVLAHGALGPADELVLVVPAIALLVLAVGALRRYDERRAEGPPHDGGLRPQEPDARRP